MSKDIERQIIFVCHSLGGLVVKQALVLQDISPALKAIQQQTSGIVFLGTPHGGSDLARTLGRIAFVTGASRSLSHLLSTGSEPLSELNSKFKEYYTQREQKGFPLRIRSWFEELWTRTPIPFVSLQVVPIESGKTHLKGDDSTAATKDHHSICRFESENDPLFQQICKELGNWMGLPRSNTLNRVRSSSEAEGLRRGKIEFL